MFQIEGITVYAQAQSKETVQSILVISREAVLVTAEDVTEGVSQMQKAGSRHVQRAFSALLEIVGSRGQDWGYRSSPPCLKQHPKPDKSLTGMW